MIYGLDVSQWNNYIPSYEEFVFIKMSGGDAGLYFDSKATLNYSKAKNAGKVVGGYHFAGGGDPIVEANYFIRAMTPIEEYDIFILDWEIQHANPVQWVQSFVNEVHAKTGVWCIVYLNISTTNAYDWTPVLSTCGLWLAAPSISYDQNAPISHPYIIQQGPIVDGIDQDVSFITLDQLKAYGYHTVMATPVAPAPAVSQPGTPPIVTPIISPPTQSPVPVVSPPSADTITPVVVTTPAPVVDTTSTLPSLTDSTISSNTVNTVSKTKTSWWKFLLSILNKLNIFRYL